MKQPSQTSQENIPKGSGSDFDIQNFKEVIKEYQKAGLEIQDTIFLNSINIDELTKKDMEMWNMVENVILTEKSIKSIKPKLDEYYINMKNFGNESRKSFAGFLENRSDRIDHQEYIDEQDRNLQE